MEEGELKMKDKIFGVLQRVGRSFMLPIAILPVAGLLLGIGSSFTNATTIETYHLTGILGEGTIAHALLMIMSRVGSTVFDNLPLLFAIGVAIGMAKKEKEVAALSSVIAYLVMHTSIYALLLLHGKIAEDGQIADFVLEGSITSVCGIPVLADRCVWRNYRRTCAWRRCTTGFTGSNCRVPCPFSAGHGLYRSYPRLCISLPVFCSITCGRPCKTVFMRWAVL